MTKARKNDQQKGQPFAYITKRPRNKVSISTNSTLETYQDQQMIYDYIESLEAKEKQPFNMWGNKGIIDYEKQKKC